MGFAIEGRSREANGMEPSRVGTRQISELAEAVNRLAAALERAGSCRGTLGQMGTPRYTQGEADQNDVVGEKVMAELLSIPRRTLADHRRRYRLDGCWVRNGRRYFWNVAATLAAWEKGIG